MVVIRRMAAGDLDQVMSLAAGTPEAPQWDRAVYERNLVVSDIESLRQGIWVAEDAGRLAGFAAARLVADICEIEAIAVVESARRKGVGSALLRAASAWASALGAQKMELEVRAGNERAIRFYETAGWLREGLRRGYYSNPNEDAVLMGKSLGPGARTVENFPQKSN
jgi:[ribosomal protein S18]-alanine N-acetyltransferase